jgi:hypothetical protein
MVKNAFVYLFNTINLPYLSRGKLQSCSGNNGYSHLSINSDQVHVYFVENKDLVVLLLDI